MLAALNPRRRLLVLLTAALVVTGGLAGGLYAALAGSGPALRPAPQDRPGPVLLVPGFGGDVTRLQVLAAALRAAGRLASVVALPDQATGDLAAQAGVLDRAVAAAERAGARSVDVVGYSDGGLVARWWVRHDGGQSRARRVILLGTPDHGTQLADLASGDPGLCPTACEQVTPDSVFLAELNAGDETPPGPQWVTIWSRTDGTVLPPDSTPLAGATNVVVQDVCPGDDVRHSALPTDPAVVGIVVTELTAPGVRPISSHECAALLAVGSR